MDEFARIVALALAAPPYRLATGALADHPAFAGALADYGNRFEALAAGGGRLARLLSNPWRFSLVGLLTALHAFRDPADPASGATVTRLQTLAATSRTATLGQVSTFVKALVDEGYVAAAPVPGDRRARRLEPAPPLTAYLDVWSGIYLDLIDRVTDDSDLRARIAATPDFHSRWQREWLLRTIQLAGREEFDPAVRQVAAKDGAQLMLTALVTGVDADGIVALPYSEAARRFGLSRTQMRAIVAEFAGHGWVSVEAGSGQRLRPDPAFLRLARHQIATLVERYIEISERALAAGP
jgi:hypothetical protein